MTDYTLGDTISLMFTTRNFSTGAPFTLAGTPVISAYADGSTTELTAGITLTADFDSRAGLNLVSIVASGGNGYAAGKDYNLVITTGTVNSVSVVGEVIGRFTLQRSAAKADTAAIKAKTDSLTFTVAGQVDANIQSVNDVTVNGTGAAGNTWGP